MSSSDQKLREFVTHQSREFGGRVEVDTGFWTLFAVDATNEETNALAQSLLANATFAYDSGLTEDDKWMLYYVDTANRAEAMYWLDDLGRMVDGEPRPASPAQRELIAEVAGSNMPHRVAQRLAEMHGRAELSPGIFHAPPVVRALLDRLHGREPLFFSAFQTLLTNHLIDMVVLLRQLIAEDVALQNEIVTGSLSRDPFLQSRQAAAAEIRNFLIRFHVINSLDQQKNTAIDNPYAAHLEIVRNGDEISALIDGNTFTLPRESFLRAVRVIRRNTYKGEQFNRLDTQAPWMNDEIAYSVRFIKQRLDIRRDLAPLDALYMLDRSVSA